LVTNINGFFAIADSKFNRLYTVLEDSSLGGYGGFDADKNGTATLSGNQKGRGLGDCWSTVEYVWDGKAFIRSKSESDTQCKGFAGGIKRHNFARGPMGHGSKSHREPGSTGAMISGPGGRVLKGKKLPGRMGGERVTVQRLTIVRVDSDRNLILIKGAIPGPKKGFVVIKDTVKPAKAAKE